jgi:hypothetical protein
MADQTVLRRRSHFVRTDGFVDPCIPTLAANPPSARRRSKRSMSTRLLDGEIVSWDERGIPRFSDSQADLKSGRRDLARPQVAARERHDSPTRQIPACLSALGLAPPRPSALALVATRPVRPGSFRLIRLGTIYAPLTAGARVTS